MSEQIRYFLWGDDCLYAGFVDRDVMRAAPPMSTPEAPPSDVQGAWMRRGGEWIEPVTEIPTYAPDIPPQPADWQPGDADQG